MQAYAPLVLPPAIAGYRVMQPDYLIVVYISKLTVLEPVYALGALDIAIGLVIIAALFLLGVVLIDRSLTRRILRLQAVTHEVARGDFSQRIRLDPGVKWLGPDEIDELAASFNAMVRHVQQSTSQLQSANDLKSTFIRVAGHELRTPVSYVLAMARLLKDSADPTRLGFAVQSIGAKARRLNEIIQAMFKLMPDAFTGEAMKCTKVNLSELLEEIYIDIFPFVELRNQRLIVEMIDRLPLLTADKDKLRNVIENLLMNAVKFTPDGGVVHVRCSLQLGDRVMISVQDQGPGIPESEQAKLFQPFYSGGDVLMHSSGEVGYQKRGIGLGLAIVKHFVDLHHGTVRVSSGTDGTTFSVTIPIEPPGGAAGG